MENPHAEQDLPEQKLQYEIYGIYMPLIETEI